MPAYATRAQLETLEGWTTLDTAATDALLERASRDIDRVFGPVPYLRTGTFAGFKIDPAELDTVDAQALAVATCRQAVHRSALVEGTDAPEAGVRRVKGPDYEVEYGEGRQASSGRYSPDLPGLLVPLAHLRGLAGARIR